MYRIKTISEWLTAESLKELVCMATRDIQDRISHNSVVEMFVGGEWKYWGRARKLLNTYWGNVIRLEQGVKEEKGTLVSVYKNTPVYWVENRYGREIKIQDGYFVDEFTAKDLI